MLAILRSYLKAGVLSRQFCCFLVQTVSGEIMTQNLCSKQETLPQPQEEDTFYQEGEKTSGFFFCRYSPHSDKT